MVSQILLIIGLSWIGMGMMTRLGVPNPNQDIEIQSGREIISEHHGNLIPCSSNVRKKMIHRKVSEKLDARSLSPGCHFIENHPSYKRYLFCDSDNITSVPRIPSDFQILDVFELNSTSVEVVRKDSFQGTRIRALKLNFNEIKTVEVGGFDGMEDTVTIQIMHNKLNWIWFDIFQNLDNLTSLQLEYNQISFDGIEDLCVESDKVTNSSSVPVLPKLVVLTLKQNPLKIIPRTLFAPLRYSRVNYLNLQNCELTDIHPEALTYLPTLRNLDLSQNPALMPRLPKILRPVVSSSRLRLTKLKLNGNGLSKPPLEVLDLFSETLRTVSLSNNLFGGLQKDSFPKILSKLEELHLSNCKLRSLGNDLFEGMPNLRELIISGNHFRYVPPPIQSVVNLITLDLSENVVDTGIEVLPLEILPNVFQHLGELRRLLLTKTWIRGLKTGDLNGLQNLIRLDFSGSKLGYIEDFSLSHLTKLEFLHLDGNPDLTGISDATFTTLSNLNTLYLNSTGFSLPKGIPTSELNEGLQNVRPFNNLQQLQSLYLQDNKLTYLHSNLFSDLHNLRTLDLSRNKIETWTSRIFENNNFLQELSLQQNQFYTVSEAMLEDFSNGRKTSVDLSWNQLWCDSGSCQLKEFVENRNFSLQNWEKFGSYQCRNPTNFQKFDIQELSDEFCAEMDSVKNSTTTEEVSSIQSKGTGSSLRTLLFIFFGILSLLGVLGGLAYFKRNEIRFCWFGLKLNVMRHVGKTAHAQEASLDGKYEYDVFVSYSQYDSDFIQSLVPKLEGQRRNNDTSLFNFEILNEMGSSEVSKTRIESESDTGSTCSSTKAILSNWSPKQEEGAFRVCLHVRDFQAGAPITENIIECVDRSRKMLIVISKNYLESQWCLFEMNLAYHRLIEERRSSFVLILLEQIPQKSRTKILDYLMKSRTYLEWPQETTSESETELRRQIFWRRLNFALSSTETESNC